MFLVKAHNANKVLSTFPKERPVLPEEYKEIYDEHYLDSREGRTKVTSLAEKMERWLHKMAARTSQREMVTLEIGAGTLNQLPYESAQLYDIVEPYELLYRESPLLGRIRNIYADISEIPTVPQYDRIISVATFEHICNLPEVVEKCSVLLNEGGVLCASIPNEGRFLWHFAYTMTTGKEFRKKFGLDYEVWMRYEHVNTADEIELILCNYFGEVRCSLMGLNRDFSFYRYYECRRPLRTRTQLKPL